MRTMSRQPERQRGYVLTLQPRDDGEPGLSPDALRNMGHMVVDIVKSKFPTWSGSWFIVSKTCPRARQRLGRGT